MRPEETIQTARLEMRTSKETHALIKRAASLQNRTLTDFVVEAARRLAQEVIRENEILELSKNDQKRFADALLSPPAAAPALKRAFSKHRELVADE